MAQVIKIPVNKITAEDREVMAYAKEFREFGFTKNESALAAAFFHKIKKLEKKIKRLEKGKNHV